MVSKNIAVVFAAGNGARMTNASAGKQFLEFEGKSVLAYTLEHFQRHEAIDAIILVIPEDRIDYCMALAASSHLDKLAVVIPGGSTSQESIRIGLEKVKELYGERAVVLIHDGVRPLIDSETITACIQSVRRYGSAVTVSPQTETLMLREGSDGPYRIIDRDRCQMARAPQCFYLQDILEIHQRALTDGNLHFIDSASLMEYYGYALHPVTGPAENIKITTEIDFYAFCAIMNERKESEANNK